MVVEALGGIFSGSLALIADAGHMLTDTAALGLSWYAIRVGKQPATADRSYGFHRFQVLAAFMNGGTLLGISVWITLEAIQPVLTDRRIGQGAHTDYECFTMLAQDTNGALQ